MERIVEKLPAKIDLRYQIKRVCAYARVSTGKEAMLHSLSAQVSYYQDYIQSHPGWKFSGIYADEAITGTKEQRTQFQKMLTDCRKGKIDLIITKSISRFARNTITLLNTIRELKRMGVEVYFEEQNIYSLSTDGEVMLTILASYAQEESLSVSENMKWRVKKNFEEGKLWGMHVYGYRYVDDRLIIVPHEAEVVRRVFREYLEGKGTHTIMRELNEEGIKPKIGDFWRANTIRGMLADYAYTGNLILQKTFRKDHLTKRSVKNNGEIPMYHAEGTHEPIIPIEEFEAVQKEYERRSARYRSPQGPQRYPFTGLLRCPYCGANYQRKKGARTFQWRCFTYLWRGKEYCSKSKTIPEDILIKVTSEILGCNEITTELLEENFDHIDALEGNVLRYCFLDGRVVEKVWQDRSRKESWTPEMREAARQASIKGGDKSCRK